MSEIITADEAVEKIYVIHCLDDLSCGMVDNGSRFGGSVKRMSVYPEHRAWQQTTADPASPHFIKKVAAGPLESDDGKYMIGSMFIIEASREAIDAFLSQDPFTAAGVWENITINRWVSTRGIMRVNMEMDGTDRTTLRMVVDWNS